jgi:hypothetical protein
MEIYPRPLVRVAAYPSDSARKELQHRFFPLLGGGAGQNAFLAPRVNEDLMAGWYNLLDLQCISSNSMAEAFSAVR